MRQPEDNINDILDARERILMVAWNLPNDGPLTEAQRTQAMGNFADYIRRQRMTAADVAHQVGKPKATTIGDLMKGVFRANADQHIRRLNLFIEQHARARAASLTDRFVSTKVAKDIFTVARLTRENKTMGLAMGPSGIGKSRCAQAIHEKYIGSVFVRIIKDYRHPKGLTHALAGMLGVGAHKGGRADAVYRTQLERVIDVLRNSDRLLIIDEAHALQDGAVELLRDTHDMTGVPILCLATRDFHDRLLRNADQDHGQVYSRFDILHHLTEGYDVFSGGKVLHTMDDIRALYNEPPVRLSTDAARYLQGVANMLGHGSLRRCKMLLQNAVRRARKRQGIAEGAKVTVTADDLEWVETRVRRESSEQATVTDRRRRVAGLTGS